MAVAALAALRAAVALAAEEMAKLMAFGFVHIGPFKFAEKHSQSTARPGLRECEEASARGTDHGARRVSAACFLLPHMNLSININRPHSFSVSDDHTDHLAPARSTYTSQPSLPR